MLRATRPWRHNLCALPLVRCKTFDPFSTTSSESQESYLTTGMLPYKYSSFFPPTHGSIMLPPRQPRVFSRLARWQLVTPRKHHTNKKTSLLSDFMIWWHCVCAVLNNSSQISALDLSCGRKWIIFSQFSSLSCFRLPWVGLHARVRGRFSNFAPLFSWE